MIEVVFLFAFMSAATVFYVNLLLLSLQKSTGKTAGKGEAKDAGSSVNNNDPGNRREAEQSEKKYNPRSTFVREYADASGKALSLLSYTPLSANGYAVTEPESSHIKPQSGIYF